VLSRPSRSARRIGIAGLLASATLLAAGCSGPASTTQSATSLLTQIQQRGQLRVADCLSFAPFGFKDDKGQPAGYDVDIANEMASELGVKAEIVDTTSANRIPNLQTDKVDVVICNFTMTTERAKQIAFTDPYVVAGELLLVRKNSGVHGIGDLGGKSVAVVKGSTNGDIIKSANPAATVQEFDSSAAAVLAVKQGQADAMVEDSNFEAYQAKLDPSLAVTSDSLVPLEYNSFGVKQGDPTWLQWLNTFLFQLNTSGKNKELYQKWFGVPPKYPLHPAY
jgi:polar amino acid transport system substrate-binding protein